PGAASELARLRAAAGLRRADAGEPLGETRRVGRSELDRVAGRERALAVDGPDGEQAPSLGDERVPGPCIDDEPAGHRLRVAQPELERALRPRRLGREARAATLPADTRDEP